MNTPTDKADLIAQAKNMMQEVNDFLTGDHSDMPPEELERIQQHMMAKQSMAMSALLQAMGYKEKRDTLLQSQDAELDDIKRRAGLAESGPNAAQAWNFRIMGKIGNLVKAYNQKYLTDSQNTARIAQEIISLASDIKEG